MKIKLYRRLLFFASICGIIMQSEAQIMENFIKSNKLMSTIQEVLIEILKDCKKDYDTILIFADSVAETNFKWIQELQTEVSIISHQNLSIRIEEFSRMKRLDAHVIIIQSLQSVEDIYQHLLRISEWVDGLIPIYVLTTELCDNININLKNQTANLWEVFFEKMNQFKVVTAYLMCSNANGEIKIYTYNMFTDRAPQLWKRMEKMIEGPWTIYERNALKDKICEDLDFDRTNHLDGFKLIIASGANVVNRKSLREFRDASIINKEPGIFDPKQIFYIGALSTALNVSCTIYFNTPVKDYDKIPPSKEYLSATLANSSFDVFMSSFTIDFEKPETVKGSYPSPRSEYGILTHHKGYQTFPEKIRDFYGIWTILFTLFITLITSIVIWLSENKKITFMVFEIIRLLIGKSLLTRINTLSLRIFFSMIFIYFLVIQATFNGHLAKFLTKPQLRPHADTFEDLQDLGYTKIYNKSTTRKYIAKNSEKRITVRDLAETCAQHILNNDTSAACISAYTYFQGPFYRAKGNLYLSKKPFGVFYTQYPISQISPLRNRIYSYFVLIEDLGISQFIRYKVGKNASSYYKKVIQTNIGEDFRPIEIEDLIFIFIILGIGLSSAMCSFLVEMCIFYHKKNQELVIE